MCCCCTKDPCAYSEKKHDRTWIACLNRRICIYFGCAKWFTADSKHVQTYHIIHSPFSYNIHSPSTQHITHRHWHLYRETNSKTVHISHIRTSVERARARARTHILVRMCLWRHERMSAFDIQNTCFSAWFSCVFAVFFLLLYTPFIVYCSKFQVWMCILCRVHVLLLLPLLLSYPLLWYSFLIPLCSNLLFIRMKCGNTGSTDPSFSKDSSFFNRFPSFCFFVVTLA